jgi:DNA primase
MLKFKEFCLDYEISFWSSDGGGNAQKDKRCVGSWIQAQCPHCLSSGLLLGFHKASGRMSCFSCGGSNPTKFIKDSLNCSWGQAKAIEIKYSNTATEEMEITQNQTTLQQVASICELPPNKPLSNRAKRYLKGRGLDWQVLAESYGVVEGLKEFDRRIIFPIYFDGRLVSYQGMSYSEDKGKRYKACSSDKEVYKHQDVVYGLNESKHDLFILCEGLADCGSFNSVEVGIAGCTFGIDWSIPQMRSLKESGKKIYLMYDSEPKARNRAEGLCSALAVHGVEVENIQLGDGLDPNDLDFEEIDEILEYFGV